MEQHKELGSGTEKFRPVAEDGFREYFHKAYAFTQFYYQSELDRIWGVKWEEVQPDFFFREVAWVVHATGFSAKAVGGFMSRLMVAYGPFEELANKTPEQAIETVRVVCNNPQKIKAVHRNAVALRDGIRQSGWEKFREQNLKTPDDLTKLAYVGPVTCFHLARNIGLLECVKPDLHLIRLANHWGFSDCIAMCKAMQDGREIPLGIVDLCVWYLASSFGTKDIRAEGIR